MKSTHSIKLGHDNLESHSFQRSTNTCRVLSHGFGSHGNRVNLDECLHGRRPGSPDHHQLQSHSSKQPVPATSLADGVHRSPH
eukprot:809195-Amphidinium_carterae.1